MKARQGSHTLIHCLGIIVGLNLMLGTATAHALSLGEIELHSKLGEQLNASIPITASEAELDQLEVIIASKAIYKRLEIDRRATSEKITIQLLKNNGASQIKVTTNSIIKEPLFEFVLSAYWGNGKITRPFTILLSP